MKKRELIQALKVLLIALAEQETPQPKSPVLASPTRPQGKPIMRFTGARIEVPDAQGQWHDASFIPREYQREDGGYWMP